MISKKMLKKSPRTDNPNLNKNSRNCSAILIDKLPEIDKKLNDVQFDIKELYKKYQRIKHERLEVEKSQQILVNRVKYLLEEKKRSKIFNSKFKYNEKTESIEKTKQKIQIKVTPKIRKRNRSNIFPIQFNSVEKKNSLSHKILINDQLNENSKLNLTEITNLNINKNNKNNNIYIIINNQNKIDARYNTLNDLNEKKNNFSKPMKNENNKLKKNKNKFYSSSNFNIVKHSASHSLNLLNSTNCDTNSNSKLLDPIHNNFPVGKFALYRAGKNLNKSYEKEKENTCVKINHTKNSKSIHEKPKINFTFFNNNSSNKRKFYKKMINNYNIGDIKINAPLAEENSTCSNKCKYINKKINNIYKKKKILKNSLISALKSNLTTNDINKKLKKNIDYSYYHKIQENSLKNYNSNSASNLTNNFHKKDNIDQNINYIKKLHIKNYSKENNNINHSNTLEINIDKPLNKNNSYKINIENKKRELGIINFGLENSGKIDNIDIRKIKKYKISQEKIKNNSRTLSNSNMINNCLTEGVNIIKVQKRQGVGMNNLNFKRKNDTKITFKDINNYLNTNNNFMFNPISLYKSFEMKNKGNNRSLSNEENNIGLKTKKEK